MPNTHGGKDRGQGRKSKPLDQHRKQLMVSLPPDLYQQVKQHGKQSKLIQTLLIEYFKEYNQ